MDRESDTCLNCGLPLGLLALDEEPVEIPGKGTLCPHCYNSLTREQIRNYFS